MTEVVRHRLLRQLDEAAPGAVVVIVAAAGGGKTTLLRQWVAGAPEVRRTVGLAPGSEDVDQLGRQIVGAIAEVVAGAAPLHELAASAAPDWMCGIAPRLHEVLDGVEVDLALDDVHDLRSPASVEFLSVLVRRWHGPGRLILCGRQRPDAPLARPPGCPLTTMRDLDLDDAELAALAATEDGIPRDDVIEATAGWPPGVRLGALATPGRDLPSIAAATWEVGAFLERQVLDRLTEHEIELLGLVAALAPVDIDVADEVLARDDVADIVQRASDRGLPMVEIVDDGERRRVVVHSLLADLLVHRLEASQPDSVAIVRRRAVELAERHRDVQLAFAMAVRLGDTDRMASMIYRYHGHLALNGDLAVLASWLARFTPAEIAEDPRLGIAAVHTLRPRSETVVRERLSPFEEQAGPRLPDGLSPAGGVRQTLIALGFEPCADEDLDLGGGWQQTNHNRYAWQLYCEGRHDEARLVLRRLEPTASRYAVTNSMRLARLALLALDAGEVDAAQELADQAASVRDRGGFAEAGATYFVNTVLVRLARQRGDLGRAVDLARSARAQMAMVGDGTVIERAISLVEFADLALDVGEWATARALVLEAREAIARWPLPLPRVETDLAAVETRAAAAPSRRHRRGDLALTAAELRVLHHLPSHYGLPEIADLLFVSVNTVRTHRNAIFRKLGVTRRSDAVAVARERGLLASAIQLRNIPPKG